MYLRLLSAIILTFSLSSCATLFGDKDKTVRVESNPPGAKIYVNNLPFGKTPAVIALQNLRSGNHITLKLDGYETTSRPIATSIQPVAFLNLLNILCWGIDFLSDSVMKLDTKMIFIDLDKKTNSTNNENILHTPLARGKQCKSDQPS